MTREVFQEYDCPQGMDFDLDGDRLVYKGQAIQCSGCGQQHIAGVDVTVHTFVDQGDERTYPDTPESAEDLRRLIEG